MKNFGLVFWNFILGKLSNFERKSVLLGNDVAQGKIIKFGSKSIAEEVLCVISRCAAIFQNCLANIHWLFNNVP